MLLDYDLEALTAQALSMVGFPVYLTLESDVQLSTIFQELQANRFDDVTATASSGLVALKDASLFYDNSLYFIKVSPSMFAEVRVNSSQNDPPLYAKINFDIVAWRSV